MTKEKLMGKLAEYEASKQELVAKTFADEIEAEVAEYKKTVEAKYEAIKAEDLEKHEHYIALLKELIAEAEEEELAALATEEVAADAEVTPVV